MILHVKPNDSGELVPIENDETIGITLWKTRAEMDAYSEETAARVRRTHDLTTE